MLRRTGHSPTAQLTFLLLIILSSLSTSALAEVQEQEPNNTIEQAQVIHSNAFNLSASKDIANAHFLPHVTINGDKPSSYDYFRISVPAGSTYIFDVDYGRNAGGSFDSYLALYDAQGNELDSDDDSRTSDGAGGSVHGYDSYLVYTFDTGGDYVIRVGACCGSSPIPSHGTYKLQISQSIDSDQDGMDDRWELLHGLNPGIDDADADADGDGWSNEEEYNNGGDPQVADRDNDGLPDNREQQLGTNPDDSDSDNDGMPDGWEVEFGLNPLVADGNLDTDGDSWTNEQEYENGSNPLVADRDNDGLPDTMDTDDDNDGLSDNEERSLGTDPLRTDSDGDGWNDAFEVEQQLNPLINDRNLDPDFDGLDNEDEINYGSSPVNPDTDADGLSDGVEVHDYDTNPAQADTDQDGLSDREEIIVYGLNPTNSDSDNDGMSDGWEVQYGLDPKLATDDRLDRDGDGWINLQEFQRNSDPTSSAAVPDTRTAIIYSITNSGQLVTLDLQGDNYTVVGNLGNFDDNTGLAINPIDDQLYTVGSDDEAFYRVNKDTGQATLIGYLTNVDDENYGLAFDDRGNLYLVDGYSLYQVDLDTGETTIIAEGAYGAGLAWHQGAMYSISRNNADLGPRRASRSGVLNRIDLQTGAIDIIGSLGISLGDQAGLTSTGSQLIGYSESTEDVLSINPLTGLASILYDVGDSIESLAFAGFESGSDNDGMGDEWELENQLDPMNPGDAFADSDRDGLINLQEFLNHTDPNNPDSDNDGLKDGEEFFTYRTGLDDSDSDNDSLPDGWEVNNGLNPLSYSRDNDPDGDHLSNLQEYNLNTLPNDSDSDNDGLSDYHEWNNYGTNPTLADSDGDKMPDGWEVEHSLNWNSEDGDADPDNDNLSNLTEYRLNTDPNAKDSDGDGLEDDAEVNTHGTNPAVADSDHDGLSDREEINIYRTDPKLADSDNDGMHDGWEVDENLNPLLADAEGDTDGDGLSNLEEFNRGSSPSSADSDGDGIADGNDSDNEADNGVPVLTAVPIEFSMSANALDYQRGMITLDNAYRATFSATDEVDSVLEYRARIGGLVVAMNADDELLLSTGRNVVSWTAVDSAGNESNVMEQLINVYPRISFVQRSSMTGEASSAEIEIQMSGPSPEYPVIIEIDINKERTDISQMDVDTAFNILSIKTVTIDVGEDASAPNTSITLTVPVLADSEEETDETLAFYLLGAVVAQDETNWFVVDGANDEHELTITERNLAPVVTLLVSQGGNEVEMIDPSAGEVTINAVIRDPNGTDTHTVVWELVSLNVSSESSTQDTVVFDPANIPTGRYLVAAVVTDDAESSLTTTGDVVLEVSALNVDPSPETPTDSSSKSSGGAMPWMFMLVMMVFAYGRRRRTL